MLSHLLLGFFFAVIVSFTSFRFRFLNLSGAVATAVIGTLIFGFGGLQWSVPLLVFFFSSSFLSKLHKHHDISSVFEKTSTRDGWQVLANGGVSAVIVILWFAEGEEKLYWVYLGSLAAVTADTWGTEFGMMKRGRTVSLRTFQSVPTGTSGAVSFFGTLGGVFGAFVISISGLYWMEQDARKLIVLILLAGVIGSFIDSLLGASLQAQYTCEQCSRVVERTVHCGVPTKFYKGVRWVTNDWVNLVCSLSGASIMLYFAGFA